ncbi:uncharacterized protein LOC105432645 [Pogonomyrmex barbatus]|uniref:Uncharacterized protein LOC105432645 n=1 Tax=Pogonomyrmex barbatus TaxID=144034 RepID=A0A8N1SBQ8_9HYME|nr:uncharacterized protein LOC105432645 [Pogonomyrmex barbatus]
MEIIYPPIEDLSNWKSKWKKTRQAWHDKIKNLETVEEKLFEINMPRYYGWKSLILNEHVVPYNSLSHVQYITRTHVVKESGLPTYYDNIISTEQLDNLVQVIKSDIENDIIFEYCIKRRELEIPEENRFPLEEHIKASERKIKLEDVISKALIQRINKTMLVYLASRKPHLLCTEVDFEPRLEASWFAGGIDPPSFIRRFRRSVNFLKKFVNDPVDLPVQYFGQPVMHLRYKHPLREIIPLSDCENAALDVPTFKFNPRVLAHILEKKHLTNIPGFWPGDENEFGFLSYHNCTYLQKRPEKFNNTSEALTVQAVLASYSWLLSQACYQEIYDWQKIYIIQHKTRPMDKKREPWEFGIKMYKRRLDDHQPAYIPRFMRENPKKRKVGRWAKTYYP